MNQAIVLFLHQQWISAQPCFFCLLPFFLVLFGLWFKKPKQHIKYNFPPSPWKLPIIGNLHQLHGPPHLANQSLAKRYGPLMLLHLGRVPTLVVSSAEMVQEIMKTHDLTFSSRPNFSIAERLLYGKDIAFHPYNEYWRQVRKLCVLQLLSVKKVQSFRHVREEEVACMAEKIKLLSSCSLSVNLSEMFVFLPNNVISRATFGRKYNEEDVGRKFNKVFEELGYLLGSYSVGDLIPSLAWVNTLNGFNARVEKNFHEVDLFLEQVIEEHIEKKKKIGCGESEGEDFVDVLMGIEKDKTLGIPFARDNVKAIALDMFAAGTDTTSIALEWAMSELMKNPKIMKEVQEEVRGIAKGKLVLTEDDNIDSMRYLKSVIKETLRLHPPIPLIFRESIQHTKIQGYDIPDKTTVLVNAHYIGRDPKAWEEPERFWPKRFMNGSGSSIDFKGQDFGLIFFGGGRRGCLGTNFGLALIELTLANLLNIFDWGLPDGMEVKDLDMDEGSGLSMHRKNNLLVTAVPHYA